MADIKISELTTASEIKNEDNIELSQNTGSGLVSLKATILALATKIVTAINFTSALQTTNKTITGAINEIAQGGGGGGTDIIAEEFDSTATYAVGDYCIYEGSLYKCTTAVTTAGDWDSSDWTETLVMDEVENGGGGGGTGHTILDDSGTSLAQENNLQFKGAYSHDDSTNGKTVVDIVRSMTKAEFNQLPIAERKGVIVITDEDGGGSTSYNATLVYDGSSQSSLQTSIELSNSYDEFDALYFLIKFGGDGSTFEGLLLKEQIDYGLTNSKIIGFAAFASVYAGGKISSDKKTFTNIYGGGNIQNIIAVYGLKYGNGGGSGTGGINYSTTEQDTGLKWINGETIYQKTVYYAGGVSGTVTFAHGISNLDIPLYAEGICYDTYQSGYHIIMPRIDNNGYHIGIMAIDATNIQYYVPSVFSNRITDVYVTLRYTKSSS